MATYYPTIGLEIHAELNTVSKMFSNEINDPFHGAPNTHIGPVSMAYPGALSVPNIKAMESVVRVGLAIGGTIANFTEFDRKNYFYPDIPKGYQISQLEHPIVSGGSLAGVEITRIHLEEDTGTSKHAAAGSVVDFNRAGVPLMELVTEPVIHSAEQAMSFAKELQLLLRYLGVSNANMEKGEMRVEVNISISPDPKVFGTKVEVKNINSFKAAGSAIDFEIKRMTALWDEGRQTEIVQETRGWDENKQKTISQRVKETSNDYRYFPDPDFPKYYLHTLFDCEKLKKDLPELPAVRRERYMNEYGIKKEDTEMYVQDTELGAFFEAVVKAFTDLGSKDNNIYVLASNYISSDLVGIFMKSDERDQEGAILNESIRKFPDPVSFAKLMIMLNTKKINSRGAKDILALLVSKGGDPVILATERGLLQQNDASTLRITVQKVIDTNQQSVSDYSNGKENALTYLIGQVMKETRGSANPELVTSLLKEMLVSSK